MQVIGTATLDDNAEAKETWTTITERFAATLAKPGPSEALLGPGERI